MNSTSVDESVSWTSSLDSIAEVSPFPRLPINRSKCCGSETILLVEDEAFVREVAAEILHAAGYQLLVASDAMRALELCQEACGAVDLLLADIILPGMNGRELAHELETLSRCSRVLLMSGHAEQLAGKRSGDKEVHLAKPFTMPALLHTVREALDA